MGKITNLISSEIKYDKDFLQSLLSQFVSLPIQCGKIGYSSEKKCFSLEIILSEKNTIRAIIFPDRPDYVSFTIFEDDDIRIANHLPLDRFIKATEGFYDK